MYIFCLYKETITWTLTFSKSWQCRARYDRDSSLMWWQPLATKAFSLRQPWPSALTPFPDTKSHHETSRWVRFGQPWDNADIETSVTAGQLLRSNRWSLWQCREILWQVRSVIFLQCWRLRASMELQYWKNEQLVRKNKKSLVWLAFLNLGN